MRYSVQEYRAYLIASGYAAASLTIVAVVLLAIGGIFNLAALAQHKPASIPWSTYGAMWLVIPGSYFLAALVAGSAVYILRPLRRSVLGWALSGAAVGAAIYGMVGLVMVVFYNPVGAYFMDNSSRQDILQMMPGLLAITTPVGAFVGVMMWWKNRRGELL